MPYYIAAAMPPVQRGDTASALNAVGNAYAGMRDSLKDVSGSIFGAANVLQDNADAGYLAALNRYTNDPNGLAKALQNGNISTKNVRAETIAKTQPTLSYINKYYNDAYDQKRLEDKLNWLDQNGTGYLKATDMANRGDVQGLSNYKANVKAPAEVVDLIGKLDAQSEQDKLAELAIRRAGVGIQGSQLALDKQRYDDAIAARGALFDLQRGVSSLGLNGNPYGTTLAYKEAFQTGVITDPTTGTKLNVGPLVKAIIRNPEASEALQKMLNTSQYDLSTPSPTSQTDLTNGLSITSPIYSGASSSGAGRTSGWGSLTGTMH